MKILLAGSYIDHTYSRAFFKGFSSLGHDVIKFDTDDYTYGKSRLGVIMNRIQNRFHIGYQVRKLNKDLENVVKMSQPDLVFLYRCYPVWSTTIFKIKQTGCVVFTYNNDDPFSYWPSKSFFRHYFAVTKMSDHNFVYRNKNVEDFKGIGVTNVSILWPYYIEGYNYKMDIEKDIPVAFTGHFEDDGRDVAVREMLSANIPVTIFGSYSWYQSSIYNEIIDCVKDGKVGAEYNETLNRCQIALVFLSKLNHDTYTRRCFEIPAAGTMMMSEYTDDLNEMFPEDECAVYFRNIQELIDKCKYYLSRPEEIKRIANNGYKRLMQMGGSEIDRCKEIIEAYESYVKQ